MPAIFEPAVLGDFLLVDGGSCNLVPVDIAAKYSSLLIVSTAFYNKDANLNNLFTVLSRTFDIGKTRAGIQGLIRTKPFIIRNDVEDVSYMAKYTWILELISDGVFLNSRSLHKQYSSNWQEA